MEPLPRRFYDRNAARVAPALVGCVLVHRDGRGLRTGRIVETEAYVGEHDLACHARVGRTARTAVMYGEAGRAYVYLIYGIHPMLNAVCGPGASANAVLIRAVEPTGEGLPWLHKSASGPGNVTKAFGIGLGDNRADLCDPRASLFIAARPGGPRPRIVLTPRVGVAYSGVWADELLRFCDATSLHVSPPRP